MSTLFPGRFAATYDESFVVFLIGMRVNRPFQFRKWMQVANAMPQMVAELSANAELGFLGAENFFRFFPLTTIMVSYWRSFEHLEQYARGQEFKHLPAWRRFNQLTGKGGSVGIWHETYMIEKGQFEAVYGNMPRFGLAAATGHEPATGKRETARRRLGGENEPALPTPK